MLLVFQNKTAVEMFSKHIYNYKGWKVNQFNIIFTITYKSYILGHKLLFSEEKSPKKSVLELDSSIFIKNYSS